MRAVVRSRASGYTSLYIPPAPSASRAAQMPYSRTTAPSLASPTSKVFSISASLGLLSSSASERHLPAVSCADAPWPAHPALASPLRMLLAPTPALAPAPVLLAVRVMMLMTQIGRAHV